MRLTTGSTLVVVTLLCLTTSTHARSVYAARLPNGGSVPSPDGSGSVCNGFGHVSCFGGGARNEFGRAFEAANLEWTVELCEADSDGDGLTNGQELGDPCCTWSPGDAPPMMNSALSHPGSSESVADLTAQAAVNCDDAPPPTSVDTSFWNEGEQRLSREYVMSWALSTEETQYVSFPFNLGQDGQPLSDAEYLVGWTATIGTIEYVHHFVVYGCDRELEASELEPFNELTRENYARRDEMGCSTEIAIWAPGLNVYSLPSDVALPLGPGTSFRAMAVQVHYNNPAGTEGVLDTSSITFHLTTTPRVHDMAFLQLGDILLFSHPEIPPGKPSWGVTHRCLIQTKDEQDLTVFAHGPHMHFHGRRLWSEKIATGGGVSGNGTWDFTSRAEAGGEHLGLIGRTDAYDYNLQRQYETPPGTVLRHGDLVSTTCVFSTDGKTEPVMGGLGSQDEMCIHFLSFYPADALDRTYCIAQDAALAGEWPQDNFSVVDDPEMLQTLLLPNSSIPFGYDTTLRPDGATGPEAIEPSTTPSAVEDLPSSASKLFTHVATAVFAAALAVLVTV